MSGSGSDSGSEGEFPERATFQKFWSAVVVPGEAYTVEPPLDLVLTRVTLAGDSTDTGRTVLNVATPEEDPITIALLTLNRKEQTNTNLVFSSEEEVTFSVVGKNKIHLSGYYELPENFNEEFDSDEDDYEEEDGEEHVHGKDCDHEVEAPQPVATKPSAKRKQSEETSTPVPEKKAKTAKKTPAGTPEAKPTESKTPAKKAAETPATKATPAKKAATPESNVTKHPNGLIIEEIVIGSGQAAQAGKKIGVKYAGFLTNGKKFDSSLDKPFHFKFGAGQVIQGWDLGLKGMRIGGKRKLTIPAKLAYGNKSTGPIPANSDLVFNVELCTVKQ